MYKYFFVLAALGLGGCATVDTIKANPSDLGALQGQPFTVVGYQPPPFTAMTAGAVAAGSLFGAVGGAIAGSSMNSAGNRIVAENGVADPAIAIAAQLERGYAGRIRAPGIHRVVNSGDDSVEAVSGLVGGKGLVFDLKTQGWMFGYFPGNWARYRVSYVARARLIDASSGKLIGQAPCQYISDSDSGTAPSYDELLANQAELLKSRLNAAVANCTDVIARSVLDDTVVAAAPAPAPAPVQPPAAAVVAAPLAPVPPPSVPRAPPAPPATPVQPVQAQAAARAPGLHVATQPLSLLRQPVASAPVERVIPAGAGVQLKQRMDHGGGAWWYSSYEGSVGWVSEPTLQ